MILYPFVVVPIIKIGAQQLWWFFLGKTDQGDRSKDSLHRLVFRDSYKARVLITILSLSNFLHAAVLL